MATTPPEPFIVKHLMWAHDLSMYSVIIIYITNEEKNVMETNYKLSAPKGKYLLLLFFKGQKPIFFRVGNFKKSY